MTKISIQNTSWYLNNQITYPGAPAEGLLMNVRMVNATFEDRNRTDFDPTANTNTFIGHIPNYYDHGIRAFTLCLQGGMPDYEGALNSAFNPDGSLRQDDLNRVASVIHACDQQGIAIILGCYYQRQDQVLENADAIRQGVINTARWVSEQKYSNVMIEVANEYAHRGFTHDIIRDPEGLDFDANPPRFLLAIGLPILLIIFVLIKYPRVLCGLPLRLLTFMHIIRIPVEIILFGLYQEGHIPLLMTYEGRNFDILAGMTGPLIALIAFRGGIQKQLLIFWNIIGLALLLNIVANAVLSTPLPFQQFAFERPNVAVFYFPFIWLPAVVVPAVFFAHLTSLLHLIRK